GTSSRPVRSIFDCMGGLLGCHCLCLGFAPIQITPYMPERNMFGTASPPAPPEPNHFMTVPLALLSSISKFIMVDSLTFQKRKNLKNSPNNFSESSQTECQPFRLAPSLKRLQRTNCFASAP